MPPSRFNGRQRFIVPGAVEGVKEFLKYVGVIPPVAIEKPGRGYSDRSFR